MNTHDLTLEVLDATAKRRDERRAFLRAAGGATAAVAGASLLAACGSDGTDSNGNIIVAPTPTPTSTSASVDLSVLNFALNLEYLEAQFYSYAVNGTGLSADLLTGGLGTQGTVSGGAQVPFTDNVVRAYAREIAADERAHVAFLRRTITAAAGTNGLAAQPAIDIGTTPTSAFSNAARAAGIIGAGQSFNPYADDTSFLLGAFIFEDVGVTAYKGAAPLITNKTYLEASAGILAAEAYHAGLVRTVLYRRGIAAPTGATNPATRTEAISNARDSLDGASDLDQGVTATGTAAAPAANIVPTDGNAIAFSRNTGQVLNIVYLNNLSVTAGGFFPSGVNGSLRQSGAN